MSSSEYDSSRDSRDSSPEIDRLGSTQHSPSPSPKRPAKTLEKVKTPRPSRIRVAPSKYRDGLIDLEEIQCDPNSEFAA